MRLLRARRQPRRGALRRRPRHRRPPPPKRAAASGGDGEEGLRRRIGAAGAVEAAPGPDRRVHRPLLHAERLQPQRLQRGLMLLASSLFVFLLLFCIFLFDFAFC
uniref:Uncharacterized protein n=1 Tax=Arundo donax TaxID=35708 RepID=A0A0A9GYM1_ARUDO